MTVVTSRSSGLGSTVAEGWNIVNVSCFTGHIAAADGIVAITTSSTDRRALGPTKVSRMCAINGIESCAGDTVTCGTGPRNRGAPGVTATVRSGFRTVLVTLVGTASIGCGRSSDNRWTSQVCIQNLDIDRGVLVSKTTRVIGVTVVTVDSAAEDSVEVARVATGHRTRSAIGVTHRTI